MKIPVYNLSGFGISVEPLSYSNPYDFASIHRHNYFEIFLIREGGGEQIIDFKERVFATDSFILMPPFSVVEEYQLTTIQKGILRCWINAGFPEN